MSAITVSRAVSAALAAGRPVVALESTVLTHGLPRPENLEIGLALEAAVTERGAVPATVAVLDGSLRVGLGPDELRRLAEVGDPVKVGRANLAAALVRRQSGGTTVSATMIAAAAAGIRVFATGGIGGVHRGWRDRPDVSADLGELARTPVAVVCAGPKAILDLAATAEALEALGVPVLGYRADRMPAFWTPTSEERVTATFDAPGDLADVLGRHFELPGAGGALVVNPAPAEHALAADVVDRAIARAEEEAAAAGIRGPALTPWLLAAVSRATAGASVRANRALLSANATLAAEIAAHLTRWSPGARGA